MLEPLKKHQTRTQSCLGFENEKGERKATKFEGVITRGGHIVENDLPYIKLLARENDMNKPSSLVMDLGIVSEEIAW